MDATAIARADTAESFGVWMLIIIGGFLLALLICVIIEFVLASPAHHPSDERVRHELDEQALRSLAQQTAKVTIGEIQRDQAQFRVHMAVLVLVTRKRLDAICESQNSFAWMLMGYGRGKSCSD